MKCTIPEISWHNRDPVLSVDIQPVVVDQFYRLASGGTDCHILIWHLKSRENGAVDIEVVSDLTRHQRSVNVVRWSPNGLYLASGDDDANIITWTLKTDNIPLLEGETSDKEVWIVHKILRGHKEDVYDISWSPDGSKLISGSIDNTAILWNFNKGLNEAILTDHKGFVQGVTWDPKGQCIATLSSDRVCRIYDSLGRQVKSRIYKGTLAVPESHALYNKELKYFHDDTFKSYFRRLNFSPDGNLLIVPSGCIDCEGFNGIRHTTLVFTLDCLTQPAAVLPSPKHETIAIRCCPLLFKLNPEGDEPIIDLPYRMVIAVATISDIVLYDTQQLAPFAHLQRVHYTRITDLTWSSDGLLLIASSTDGYCTFVTFEPEELGLQHVKEDSEEESMLDVSGFEELDKVEEKKEEVKPKKPNLLEQWTIKKPKNVLRENNEEKMEVDVKEEIKRTNPMKVNEVKPQIERKVEDVKIDKEKNNKIESKVSKRIVPTKIGDVGQNKPKNTGEYRNVVKSNETPKNVEENKNNCIVLDKKTEKPPHKKLKVDKVNNTPKKNNPLLQFLQNAQTKYKENVSADAEEKIIEILDDDENSSSSSNSEQTDTSEISTTADDNEISQKEKQKNHSRTLTKTNVSQTKGTQLEETSEIICIEDSNSVPDVLENKASSIGESKNITSGAEETKATFKPTTPKAPRRIALVTLSSPRRKKD